jgi:hypothetical protein
MDEILRFTMAACAISAVVSQNIWSWLSHQAATNKTVKTDQNQKKKAPLDVLQWMRFAMWFFGFIALILYALLPGQTLDTKSLATMLLFTVWVLVSYISGDWK